MLSNSELWEPCILNITIVEAKQQIFYCLFVFKELHSIVNLVLNHNLFASLTYMLELQSCVAILG